MSVSNYSAISHGNMQKNIFLTIGGLDSSGGAGINADIQTAIAHGMFPRTVTTCVTAQDHRGLVHIMPVTKESLCAQLECVFCKPRPRVIKIGLIPNVEIMETVADFLEKARPEFVVVDSVMGATNGIGSESSFSSPWLNAGLVRRMARIATLITPNLPELHTLARILKGDNLDVSPTLNTMEIIEPETVNREVSILQDAGFNNILVKGGHAQSQSATDVLYTGNDIVAFEAPRVTSRNTHGTGCVLSSALACNLALHDGDLKQACKRAKYYLFDLLRKSAGCPMYDNASGPVHFNYDFIQ